MSLSPETQAAIDKALESRDAATATDETLASTVQALADAQDTKDKASADSAAAHTTATADAQVALAALAAELGLPTPTPVPMPAAARRR